MTSLLKIQNLHKFFGEDHVLRGIDLDVKRGEKIAILGASGSGKSTLLRCINFMETPSDGTVTLAGEDVGKMRSGTRHYSASELTALRQRIGMVFQQFNLFPHMSVEGNVMEGLRTVKRQSKATALTRALKELDKVGLADKATEFPARLSGGQKQRVAIARALAMDPEILLFDEPTSSLDPELVGEVLSSILKLVEEGRTMLLVTHEIGFAYHFADRVIFLSDGVICEQGSPEQVLKNPSNERTKAFLSRHREFMF